MKRLALCLILIFLIASQVMASTDGAQFYSFGPFFNSSGTLYGTPHIYHYAAGTSTNKNCWSDQAKTSAVAQPFVGNADGTAEMYCDGDYKFVIKNTAETITIETWDNVKISSDAAIYPEWLGAVGDGSTDDTTALQAAIDEASTTGAKVMLRAKTYKHNSPLTFKPGVKLNNK